MTISRRTWTAVVAAGAAGVFALVAESAGTRTHPAIDVIAGYALLLSGIVAVAAGTAVGPGVLVFAAGVLWFLATAGWDDVGFVHRALLVHALVVAVAGPRSAPVGSPRRLGAWFLVGTAYVIALDPGPAKTSLARATPWTLAVGVGTIAVVATAAMQRRWPRPIAIVATVGTATWTGAASIVRTSGWFDQRTRLLLYVMGLAAVAMSIALWAISMRRAALVSRGDLVRDDGRGSVRVAFRSDGGGFEDIAGEPFVAGPGESAMLVDLGPEHGEVLLAHRSPGLGSASLTTAPLDEQTIDGLRLVAANRRAAQSLRTHAAEVAASAERLRIADDLAAAQLSSELERMVVPRIERAAAALGGDDSAIGGEARASLALVVDEIQGLAAGLAPAALRHGFGPALAALADRAVVTVRCDVDDVTLDPAKALVLYFAASECVTNAVRHSGASSVTIDVHRSGDVDVELTVADDGRGGAAIRADGGGGLAGVRSRVADAGGTFEVRTRRGGGTTVTVRVPMRAIVEATIVSPG